MHCSDSHVSHDNPVTCMHVFADQTQRRSGLLAGEDTSLTGRGICIALTLMSLMTTL